MEGGGGWGGAPVQRARRRLQVRGGKGVRGRQVRGGPDGLPELLVSQVLSKKESERLTTYQRELMEWSTMAESDDFLSEPSESHPSSPVLESIIEI